MRLQFTNNSLSASHSYCTLGSTRLTPRPFGTVIQREPKLFKKNLRVYDAIHSLNIQFILEHRVQKFRNLKYTFIFTNNFF